MKTSDEVLLSIQNVSKDFTIDDGFLSKKKQVLKAVNQISLDVKKSETLGIVGESGSGKSTLANLAMHLLEPTKGEIVFNGKAFHTLSKHEIRKSREDIQMIFQDPYASLNPRMKVFDIIAEPLRTHKKLSKKELEREVYQVMETVGLDIAHADRYPHEFSGGQRQRIGIARAVVLKPKLIICDEPVSALDVSIQGQILNLLKRLQNEFDLTYMFIAHGLPVVFHMSDRIAVMYLGNVVELATKNSLYHEPLHPYTKALLKTVPLPDPSKRKLDEAPALQGEIPSAINPPSGCVFRTRCPFATEKCAKEVPAFTEEKPDHFVACHYPQMTVK